MDPDQHGTSFEFHVNGQYVFIKGANWIPDACFLPRVLDLYEDGGDGYGYERGEFAFTPFRWSEQAQRLTVQDRVGAFPGMPACRVLETVLVSETSGAGAETSDGCLRLTSVGAMLDSSVR